MRGTTEAGHVGDKRARFIFVSYSWAPTSSATGRAAQHARQHPSRSVSIYAITNCHHRPNFESRALENHSPLYIQMRNGVAIHRGCVENEKMICRLLYQGTTVAIREWWDISSYLYLLDYIPWLIHDSLIRSNFSKVRRKITLKIEEIYNSLRVKIIPVLNFNIIKYMQKNLPFSPPFHTRNNKFNSLSGRWELR